MARGGAAREGACLPGTAAAKATCVLSKLFSRRVASVLLCLGLWGGKRVPPLD